MVRSSKADAVWLIVAKERQPRSAPVPVMICRSATHVRTRMQQLTLDQL